MFLSKTELQEGKARLELRFKSIKQGWSSEVMIYKDQAGRESQQGQLPLGDSIICTSPLRL